MVIIELWLNGHFKGYRTVSKPFYERLKAYASSPKCRIDIQTVMVREAKP